MIRTLKNSVCMATYNGEAYVLDQIESIICQLGGHDELIICDDASTDRTVEFIESLSDPRVVLLKNEKNLGVSATFTKALEIAKGDIIFMSDQDDIWEPDKTEKIRDLFDKHEINLIVHDAYIVDRVSGSVMSRLSQRRGRSPGLLRNLLFSSFTGCCMVFDRSVLKTILPIDSSIGIYHDAWIGVLCRASGLKILFSKEPLIKFMRHGSNASQLGFTSLNSAIKGRIIFYWALLKRVFRRGSKWKHIQR